MAAVDRFAENLQAFVEVLRDIVKDAYDEGYRMVDPRIIELAAAVVSLTDRRKTIDTFIRRSYTSWDQLRNRDFHYFAENASTILDDLPADKVEAFRQLFAGTDPRTGQPIIKEDDRITLFDFFHAKVRIAIMHIAEMRKAGNSDYCSEVNLEEEAKKWEVRLP